MKPRPVLIIEDEPALAAGLRTVVERLGHLPLLAATGRRGLDQASAETGLAILDIGLPDSSGLDVLRELRERFSNLPVIIITAHGNLENAVSAKQLGAAAYLVKPLDLEILEDTVKEFLKPATTTRSAPAPKPTSDGPLLFLGGSRAMQPAFAEIAHACASDAPVLITGQGGVGKSLAARIIHQQGTRKSGPFVLLHCGNGNEAQMEELAANAAAGTLFLEDAGRLSAVLQLQLLELLDSPAASRPRLICSAREELGELVRLHRFREDLFYRLRVLEVRIPPLADRLEDLPTLASYFLAQMTPQRNLDLSRDALLLLRQHEWPGNVRELQSVLERAAAVCPGRTIQPQHLPPELRPETAIAPKHWQKLDTALAAIAAEAVRGHQTYDAILAEIEGRLLTQLLPHFDHRPTRLAANLDMNRVTLRRKLRQTHPDKRSQPQS